MLFSEFQMPIYRMSACYARRARYCFSKSVCLSVTLRYCI